MYIIKLNVKQFFPDFWHNFQFQYIKSANYVYILAISIVFFCSKLSHIARLIYLPYLLNLSIQRFISNLKMEY